MIIDCDPGHDDAVMLVLAHRHADVVGITTVSGNAPIAATTTNALLLTQVLEWDVPVHAGAGRPILAEPVHAPEVHGESGMEGATLPPLDRSAAEQDAVSFLVEATRREEGLWLVATGPLTNVALALRADPGLAERLAGISLMGGSASVGNVTAAAEFNVWADPEAAAITFAAGCPVLMSGLDVTHQVLVDRAFADRVRAVGTPVATVVADLFVHELDRYGTYATAAPFPPLHDPVALLAVTHPHLFERQSVPIAVETVGSLTRGMTVVDRRTRTRSGDDPAAGPITTEWVHTADAPAVLDLVVEAVA
jgi:inosine-uridine nucleoside N-ribohydrolase